VLEISSTDTHTHTHQSIYIKYLAILNKQEMDTSLGAPFYVFISGLSSMCYETSHTNAPD